MKRIIVFINLILLSFVYAVAQSDTLSGMDYFNRAANHYIQEDNLSALKEVEKGLSIDPDNEKLWELADLLMNESDSQCEKPEPQESESDSSENEDKEDEKEDENNSDSENPEEENRNEIVESTTENEISEEEAERLLEALQYEENELQEDIKNKKPVRVSTEKDW